MIVCVSSVDPEPVFSRVTSAFGVCTFSLPILVRHQRQQLRRRRAGRTKGFERRRHVAFVVSQSGRILILVVTLNHRIVLHEQRSYPAGGRGLTVAQVMNDLASTPLARKRMRA